MTDSDRVVCIVHPPAYIGVNPTVYSVVSYLIDRGHDVHMISLSEPSEGVRGLTTHALLAERGWLGKPFLQQLTQLWMPLFVWRRVRALGGEIVIAIDASGAVASAATIATGTTPHFYVSLHLEYLDELRQKRHYGGGVKKLVERWVLRRMDAIITQDAYRREELFEENRLADGSVRVFILPNSYRGHAAQVESTYYQDLFGLATDEPVVLVAGSIAAWSHIEFLIGCARNQLRPPYYTMVIQSRETLPESDIRWISELADAHVVLAPEPVPIDDLSDAFGSATVGAAIYTNNFYQNQTFVGGSSGKMMGYLKAGLPVIMMDSPGVSEIVTAYRCGRLLGRLDAKDFNDLVADVIANRSLFSANAVRCYNELYEFNSKFDAVHQFMLKRRQKDVLNS